MKPVRLSMDEFCRIAGEVVEQLPDEFKAYLDNVAVDVREKPTRRQLDDLGIESEDDLMGLFEGTSIIDDGYDDNPNHVYLFKRPIENACRSREEVAYEIRRTIIHELAHHFGWSEEDLDEFESKPSPFDSDNDE